MISRDRNIQLVALLTILVSLVGAGGLSRELVAEAGRAQLTYADEAQEGDPPEVALGIAMGAFRGLFVNWLWFRANKLKEEGKFYEAIELSSAITKLQPRFPRVWVFHAWNMSYNISVATSSASERWEWVRAGINLLRSQGIPRNPNDVLLHKELAWIFFHKIQAWADDAHHYYKRELAREWTFVLGPPPTRTGTTDENTTLFADWLLPIADAPGTLEGVIEEELRARAASGESIPQDEAGRPQSLVRELVKRLREEARLDLGLDLLRLYELRRAFAGSSMVERFGGQLNDSASNEVLNRLLDDAKYADAWKRLLPHARQRVLLEVYNMEPARMLRYTREYGPLDWRHPATHALYWSVRGVDEGLQRKGTTTFDTLNTDRVTTGAIQELFRFGVIQYDLISNEYFALTDFDWVDRYAQILDDVRKRAGVADDPQRVYRLYSAGYENFLREVIRIYYNRGEFALAEKYHARLRTWDGLNTNDPDVMYEFELPLKDFVEKQVRDRVTIPHVAVSEIEGALVQAFTQGLMLRKPQIFARQVEYARAARDFYLKEQSTRTLADPETKRMHEYVREDFESIVAGVFLRLLVGGAVGGPSGGYQLGPNQAADLFGRAPTALQLAVYDDLVRLAADRNPQFESEYFARLFPPPPGLEQYRAERAARNAASDEARRKQVEFEKQ